MTKEESQPAFPNLAAESEGSGVTEIESICTACFEKGTTRLLMVRIPFFKEVIVSSFSCSHCGYSNSTIDSASEIQKKGLKITLTVHNAKDLSRQVVKADVASFVIPSLEFEQPPVQKKGEITTVEGLIRKAIEGLSLMQPQRRAVDPDNAQKIDEFLQKLKNLLEVEAPFEIVIDDPSGNSFVENYIAPKTDPNLKMEHFVRSKEQNESLGIMEPEEEEPAAGENLKDEVLSFPTICANCQRPCETNMKLVDIPFFKEVVIMCTVCDHCGMKDNEVKGGAGIEEKGRKITLHLTDPSDLNRDILKSDSCGVEIPELALELEHGTLGGKFTTIEGLLTNVKEQLSSSGSVGVIGFVGDSSTQEQRTKLQAFIHKLDQVIKGEMLDLHIIMDDPAGNSYMQNVYAPDPDPEMKIELYERNEKQNDVLGLTHMNTDNYSPD